MQQYGTDGVRVGMLLSSPAGNDLMFDVAYCEQGRNFANKIWNAFRLVKGWEIKEENSSLADKQAIHWFENRFNLILLRSEEHTSELQSLMRISYAVFCLKKKKSHIP